MNEYVVSMVWMKLTQEKGVGTITIINSVAQVSGNTEAGAAGQALLDAMQKEELKTFSLYTTKTMKIECPKSED